ncbi:phage major capsid protein [Kitasatospora sp. NPDC057500]|uniref:phage major capsid protein n=1 Tax=Kitasatospora sp. NPDC057500 TaxID=3346151 RepID=UPI0036AC8514
MRDHLRRRIEALLEQRAQLKTELDAVLAAPSAADRNLTADEQRAFAEKREAIRVVDTDLDTARTQLQDLDEEEQRAAAAAELRATLGTGRPTAGARIVSEPVTYHRTGAHSYFLDLARAELGRGDGDGGHAAARDRLQRHAAELDVELPKRQARLDAAAEGAVRGLEGVNERAAESAFERRVAPNRTDGQGGYFVPPLWMVDQYIDLPRFGRTIANSVRNMPLPSGTDSISLPKIATGTATGVQTADGAAVTSQDLTDTSVTAPVRTVAGQQDVAMQLLDQSPIAFDEVMFADLIADYNQKIDVQVIAGSGAAGQARGILNTPGINSVTYTDATPTLPEMWPVFAQAASQVAKNRKLPALATFMTPSLWYWIVSQLDTAGRPLVQVEPGTGFNIAALQTGAVAEGPAGRIVSLPTLLDGNIPSNLGAGTNESRIITARTSDLYLWEGSMRTRVLQEVLSGTLQVRFQVWNYFAFMADRRPESVSVISGTGVIPQAGF